MATIVCPRRSVKRLIKRHLGRHTSPAWLRHLLRKDGYVPCGPGAVGVDAACRVATKAWKKDCPRCGFHGLAVSFFLNRSRAWVRALACCPACDGYGKEI